MPGVSIGDTALTPSESMPLKRPETFGRPMGPQELQGSPGEVFSRTLAARRDYYSRKTGQRSQESAVLRRFFEDWRSSPELARLSADYVRDQDAVKFARGAARSDQFSRIMKRYTLEADMRNFGMELLMGSPHDVMQAWTNYTAKDPEGSELQSKLFEAMGVPAPMAQVLGNGRTDAAQMETQVRAMLPALLKGVDPRLIQQVQQNQPQPANP